MSDENSNKADDLVEVNNLEIEPLSDEDLDSVAGGAAAALEGDCTSCDSNTICTSSAS
ncbi:MAG TPA: hypothetical protein VGH73_07200 [Thermoanaerobaculia bacterium]|jgi:hypothetical protein